jgi:hypothetical protein
MIGKVLYVISDCGARGGAMGVYIWMTPSIIYYDMENIFKKIEYRRLQELARN